MILSTKNPLAADTKHSLLFLVSATRGSYDQYIFILCTYHLREEDIYYTLDALDMHGENKYTFIDNLIDNLDVYSIYDSILNKAIRKYGSNNFSVIILEDNIPNDLLGERAMCTEDK